MKYLHFIVFTAIFMCAMTANELWTGSFVVGEMGWWTAALAIVAVVVLVEKKGVASIGFKAPSISTLTTAAIGLSAHVVLLGAVVLAAPMFGIDFTNTEDRLRSASSTPIWMLILAVVRAGVVEEMFFRGYVISRSLDIGLRPAGALLFSTLLFVAPHYLFWGGAHLIIVAMGGLVYGTIFLWKRDLLACAIAHTGFNTMGLIAASFG